MGEGPIVKYGQNGFNNAKRVLDTGVLSSKAKLLVGTKIIHLSDVFEPRIYENYTFVYLPDGIEKTNIVSTIAGGLRCSNNLRWAGKFLITLLVITSIPGVLRGWRSLKID